MFTEVLLISALTAAAAIVTTTGAIGAKNVAKHATKVDVCLTALFVLIMAGTATYGVLIGLVTGLFIAIYTKTLRAYWNWAAKQGFLSPLTENQLDWQNAREYADDVIGKLMTPVDRK